MAKKGFPEVRLSEAGSKRQCTSRRKYDGKRCTRSPILGGAVCMKHGGAAPQVRKKANERLADLIDPDRALREAARLAYSDVRELFDSTGRLKPIKEWSDELAAAIGSVEVVRRNVDSGDDKTDDVIKVKTWDKPKALEMLFKHKGLFEKDNRLQGELTIKWEGE